MRKRSHKKPKINSGWNYFKYGRNDAKRMFVPDPWITKHEDREAKLDWEGHTAGHTGI